MFKRVEKRRLKKEEEEALGLDEDMKEILGMHDTDSEESASDTDDSEDEEGDEERSDLETVEDGAEDIDEDEGEEGSEEEGDDKEDPDVSVKQALEDPIYVVSVMPEVKACVICPGKVLKSVKMVQLHRTSNAHERRAKQFKTLAADTDPDESAWGILQRDAEHKPKFAIAPSSSSESKRAQKKKAHAERQKQRREKQKLKRFEAAKKKKDAAASAAAPGLPTPTSADPPPSVNTPKPDKSKSKSANSQSRKMKDDKKQHLPDDINHSEPLDSTSPPKKKRKVTTNVEGDDRLGGDVTPTVFAVSISDTAAQKEKRGKGRPRVAPQEPSDGKKKSKDTVDSVKGIVRSTSDRAKNARARALSTAAKGGSEDTTKPQKKVSVS